MPRVDVGRLNFKMKYDVGGFELLKHNTWEIVACLIHMTRRSGTQSVAGLCIYLPGGLYPACLPNTGSDNGNAWSRRAVLLD